MWDSYIRDNINKLLDRGHRVLTVAQFSALTGLEDGDEAYLEVDAANGIQWHLRYVAAEATYKWRFLGGPPMLSLVATSQSTTSASYVDLATDGPSITLPRGGDYDLEGGAKAHTGAGFISGLAGIHVNAVLVRAVAMFAGAGIGGATSGWSKVRHTGAAASQIAKLRYAHQGDASGSTFLDRVLALTPSRLRHDG